MENLNAREVSTILAALRYFQKELGDDDAQVTRGNAEGEGLPHFVELEPLTNDEIDDLCERINFGDV